MPRFKAGQQIHEVKAQGAQALVDGEPVSVSLQPLLGQAGQYLLQQGHQQRPIQILRRGDHFQVGYQGEYYTLEQLGRQAQPETEVGSGRLSAPLTGKVIEVAVAVGESVKKGQTLLILESMKMETALSAGFDAVVQALYCQDGEQVGNGQLLLELVSEE